jgi:predicted PurR-regulated permease PerM
MLLDDKPYTVDRIFRLILAMAILAGVVWLMGYLSDALIPFAVALLLAYLINPMVEAAQRLVRWRGLAVGLSLAAIAVVLAGLVVLVAPLVAAEVAHMSRLVSELVGDSAVAQRAAALLPPDVWQAVKDLAARPEVQEIFGAEDLFALLETTARKVLPGVWKLVSGTASLVWWLFGLTVVVLYLIFLLLDFRRVSARWADLVPADYREQVSGFLQEFQAIMSRYFRGQALVALLVGALSALGFALIGLPLGILLGLFVGLLNMVPYLQLVALLPAAMLVFIHSAETGASPWLVAGFTAGVFAVVQIIQDGFLVPKIMGKVTGLSPWLILLSLSIWGKLLGLLGLIVALPATFLVLAYYRRYLARREEALG